MEAAEIWDRLVCILYPPRCMLCDDVVEYDHLLCGKCAVKAELEPWQSDGGQPAQVIAPLEYSGAVRQTILALKKQQDQRVVRHLSRRMYADIKAQWDFPFDRIVPVPMAPKTLQKRKFNQAQFLADALGSLLEIEVAGDLLVRLDGAKAQHTLSREDRFENAKKSYALGKADGVKGLSILLVDDVYTTGATIQTCAGLLLDAGAVRVCGVTAAHTPEFEEYLRQN